MDDFAILNVLQTATLAAVAASSTPALPIKFIGRTFTPPTDQKYLEEVFIPNNREDFWGDEKRYQGVYRLILHWPNNDAGIHSAGAALKSITDYFVKGTLLQNVQVYEKTLTGILEEGAEILLPATIRYNSLSS